MALALPAYRRGHTGNHCKNPACENFWVPPNQKKARGAEAARGDYTVVATGKNKPQSTYRPTNFLASAKPECSNASLNSSSSSVVIPTSAD